MDSTEQAYADAYAETMAIAKRIRSILDARGVPPQHDLSARVLWLADRTSTLQHAMSEVFAMFEDLKIEHEDTSTTSLLDGLSQLKQRLQSAHAAK